MEINENEVLLLLRAAIARHGSIAKFVASQDRSLSAVTISMSLNNSGGDNRRRFPDSVLATIRVRRREVYEPIDSTDDRPPHPLVVDRDTNLFRYATHDDVRRWEVIERRYNNLIATLRDAANVEQV